MTDAERFARLRHLLIDAKDRLYEMGLTRHDPLVQRIYAGLEATAFLWPSDYRAAERIAEVVSYSPPPLAWYPPGPLECPASCARWVSGDGGDCDCGAAENIAEANSLAVDAARDNVGEVWA